MTRQVQRTKSFHSSSPEEGSTPVSSPPLPPRANRIRPCTRYQRPAISFSERLRRAQESSPILPTSSSLSISDEEEDNSFIFNADPIFDTNSDLPPLRLESPSPPPSPSPSSSTHSTTTSHHHQPVRHSDREKPSWMEHQQHQQQRNRSSRGKKKKKEKQLLSNNNNNKSTKTSCSSTTPIKPSKGTKSISAPSSTTSTITKRKQITLSATIIPTTTTTNDTWADKSRLRPRTSSSSSSLAKHRPSSHNQTSHKPRTIKAGHC